MSQTPGDGVPSDQDAAAGDWYGFQPYPGARGLCSGCLYGHSPRSWSSYATTDRQDQVIGSYTLAQGEKAERHEDGSFTIRRQHDGAQSLLTVHPALPETYPTCSNRAPRGEKTVILVSRMVTPAR